MSSEFQVPFDCADPQRLSLFWREVLGYVHPPPPGVQLAEDEDPLAAWDDFLGGLHNPPEDRNSRSALEDPEGSASAAVLPACA